MMNYVNENVNGLEKKCEDMAKLKQAMKNFEIIIEDILSAIKGL